MSKQRLLILLVFIVASCKPTQYVNHSMAEVPIQKFHYILDGEKKVVEVSSFYISTYPEPIGHYKEFMNSLPKDAKEKALPLRDLLNNLKLSNNQIEFLTTEYYKSAKYDNYPVIGLNKEQIKEYLQWKTDKTGKEILTKNKINFNPEKTYLEIVRELNIKTSFLQVELNVLHTSQAISVRNYMESKNADVGISNNSEKLGNPILESLGIKEVEYYKIDNSRNSEELVYNEIDTINYYKSIHQLDSNNYETSKEPRRLIPLRTWHIKI